MSTTKTAPKGTAKKIIERVRGARAQIEALLKDRTWIDEAKKVAEKQGQEVKKIIDSDVAKLRTFLEKERAELEKLQAQIPGEVARIKKFVDGQKKELSKLLKTVKAKSKPKKKKSRASKKTGAKSASGASAHSSS